MTTIKSQAHAFHLTDYLPDGERILIVIAADTSKNRSATSAYYLCFQRSRVVKSFPENISFDPKNVPANFRPTYAGLMNDQLNFAKAQIDHAYYHKFPKLISRTGFPSSKISDTLKLPEIAQLYMRGGFAAQIQEVYQSQFAELNKFLKNIVALPVLAEGRHNLITLDILEME